MANFELVRQKLDSYIIKKGYTYREISLKIGRKDSYIQQYIKYGFPKRLSEIDRKKICLILNIGERELIDDELLSSSAPYAPMFETDDIIGSSEDFINIDIYCPKKDQEYYQTLVGRLGLNYKEFNTFCNSNPFYTKAVRHDGDSMSPTIENSALVIYDSSITSFSVDGIYLIKYHDTIEVKRIQKISNTTYQIISDNKKYKKILANSDEIEFLGRATGFLNYNSL